MKNNPHSYKTSLDKQLRFHRHIDYLGKKLNKVSGLINGCRHLYPRKCLLLFYYLVASSIESYGLLVYGSADKTSLVKIEGVQRRIMRSICFKTELDLITERLLDNGGPTVFELHPKELLKEFLRHIRHEPPVQFLLEIINISSSTKNEI